MLFCLTLLLNCNIFSVDKDVIPEENDWKFFIRKIQLNINIPLILE
jgi:hypothetical protein